MGIKNVVLEQTGLAGVYPRFIYLETDNTLAEVTATGYLNQLKDDFGYNLDERMMALVSVKTSPSASASEVAVMDVSKSGANWSLIPSSSQVTLADGKILVGNSSNVATAVTMSGDATLSNTGVLTIANLAVETAMLAADAVTNAKLADNAVSLENLDSGITPSHIVVFAGQPTTTGGGAAEAITVTGALATDLAFVQMVDDGTNNVTIVNAVVTADTLTVTFSADPGNDAVINYQLIRAAA